MCAATSQAECRGIDELPEDSMSFYPSTDFIQAEVAYRQERNRQLFHRPGLFQRLRRTPQTPAPRPHLARARHAM
jgi:hypothetical protein